MMVLVLVVVLVAGRRVDNATATTATATVGVRKLSLQYVMIIGMYKIEHRVSQCVLLSHKYNTSG